MTSTGENIWMIPDFSWETIDAMKECQHIFLFKIFIYSFLERGGEREREEKHWFVVPLIYAFISYFLYVPWTGIEPTTLANWDDILTNWATQLGPSLFTLTTSSYILSTFSMRALKEKVWVFSFPWWGSPEKQNLLYIYIIMYKVYIMIYINYILYINYI